MKIMLERSGRRRSGRWFCLLYKSNEHHEKNITIIQLEVRGCFMLSCPMQSSYHTSHQIVSVQHEMSRDGGETEAIVSHRYSRG